jgi:hypothetical protein
MGNGVLVLVLVVEGGVEGVMPPPGVAVRGAAVALVDHGVVEPVGLLQALL